MSEAKLIADVRTETGKGAARKARLDGRVPAVLYGWETEPQTIFLDGTSIERFASSAGAGRLLQLQVGSEAHTVLLKDLQRHPVRRDVIHVDFHKVRLDQELTTNVSVIIIGEVERTEDGGIVAQVLHEVQVSCLPTNIPESIQIDLEGVPLSIGTTITVGDLTVPEGVTILDDSEMAVVTVVAPMAEVEEEVEEDEETELDPDAEDEDAEASDEETSGEE